MDLSSKVGQHLQLRRQLRSGPAKVGSAGAGSRGRTARSLRGEPLEGPGAQRGRGTVRPEPQGRCRAGSWKACKAGWGVKRHTASLARLEEVIGGHRRTWGSEA